MIRDGNDNDQNLTDWENHVESAEAIEQAVVADAAPVAVIDAADDTPVEQPVDVVAVERLPDRPGALALVDALLKAPEAVLSAGNTIAPLTAITVVCLLVYGAIVGSFQGEVQWFAAPLKIIVGVALSGLLCLPSLYIFACLSGARIRPADAVRLMWGAMAVAAVLLIGFAPVAFIFTFSTNSLPFMGAIHLGVWLIAIAFGLRYVGRGITQLCGVDGPILKIWALILILTTLQMTTTLRPLLGTSDSLLTAEKRFFAAHWIRTLEQSVEDSRQTETADID
ncbi:MAG: hypothetical protein QGG36_16285 [Pirellulaceae bacterium]|jgi:hypothetical protein|nr:hypothetical protein [Pirellulaceae bacterium]MDP7017364.1 hypothetical protein [Pirellulaceae bacterium]